MRTVFRILHDAMNASQYTMSTRYSSLVVPLDLHGLVRLVQVLHFLLSQFDIQRACIASRLVPQ